MIIKLEIEITKNTLFIWSTNMSNTTKNTINDDVI